MSEDEDLITQAIQDANNEEFQNDLLDEDLEPQDEGLTIVDSEEPARIWYEKAAKKHFAAIGIDYAKSNPDDWRL